MLIFKIRYIFFVHFPGNPNLFFAFEIEVGGVNFETLVGVLIRVDLFKVLDLNEVFESNEVFDLSDEFDWRDVLAAKLGLLKPKVFTFFVNGGVNVFVNEVLSLMADEFIAEMDDDRHLGVDSLEGIAFFGIDDTRGLFCLVGVLVTSIFGSADFSVNFRVNGDVVNAIVLRRLGTEETDPSRELPLELMEEFAMLFAGGGVGFTKL